MLAPQIAQNPPSFLTDARGVITYEYPLNERIRTLLRLEDLFERSRHFIARSDPHDHHMALLTLFEILEVSSRADLKSDLLQELERQKQVLLSFRNNPDIAEDAVRSIMAHQVPRAARLAAAHDVIDNAGTLEQLRQQVAALHARYVKMAAPAKS